MNDKTILISYLFKYVFAEYQLFLKKTSQFTLTQTFKPYILRIFQSKLKQIIYFLKQYMIYGLCSYLILPILILLYLLAKSTI